MTRASLMTSEGCALNEPRLIQLRLPPCSTPSCGTNDEQLQADGDHHRQRPPTSSRKSTGSRAAMSMSGTPSRANMPLAREPGEEVVARLERLDRRRRQHHDEAEDDQEQRRAEQQEVVARLGGEDLLDGDDRGSDPGRSSRGLRVLRRAFRRPGAWRLVVIRLLSQQLVHRGGESVAPVGVIR